MRRATLAALCALVAWPLLAQAPQASGKFTGRDWEFEPAGAYAYPGEVGFDHEPGVLVAVSNAEFRAETLDRFWDRPRAISKRFADEETLVVTFQFAPDGAYQGMSYYFGSGDGCGFCYDGKMVSTVKIAGGRLKGRIALTPQPGETSWDIDLDVPVAPAAEHGTPLTDGGGEVGAAYAAYHRALSDGDGAALAKLLPERLATALATDQAGFLAEWREDHPSSSYRVVKGFVRGDRALLVIEGETSYGKVDVEAHFLQEGGAWKINDELLDMRLE